MARGDNQQTSFFPLGGGLDMITPAIALPPGKVIAALNYEPDAAGYRRVGGFERFDGRTKPSEAGYWELDFDTGTAAFLAGNTITGATSAATGVVLADATVTSGSYGGGNAAGYVGLGAVSGTFVDGENLRVGGVTRAHADGTATEFGNPDDTTASTWQAAATENARALIGEVPGEGPVRGVHVYKGTKYAWRDNVGATEGRLYAATASGWVQKTFGRSLSFTSGGGAYDLQEGDTITGATSGATAVVRRLVWNGGTFGGTDTATGYLVISGQTGTFQAENLNVGAHLNVATIAGNSAAITLPAGGRYEVVNHNFYGASDLLRMYGVNGVGRAFEYDGTYLVPITSGSPGDTPSHLAVHQNALLLGVPGGLTRTSVVGEPCEFDPNRGTSEIDIGDDVTGYISAASGTTIILGKSSINVLYGNDSADYDKKTISDESGAREWSGEKMGEVVYMDARGLRRISTTASFGDFQIGLLTRAASPFVQRFLADGIRPAGALRVRSKDTLRLFFDNQVALSVYFGRREPEVLAINLGVTVTCLCSADTDDGEELYIGGDDGFIYQLDKGTSFDGATIPFFLRLPFNHMGSPHVLKRWHRIVLECEAAPTATIRVSADFDYGQTDQISMNPVDIVMTGGGGTWDIDTWDEFYWDSPLEGQGSAHIDGVGKNMSLLIAGETDDEPPHTLQGVTLYYSVRGLQRG
jgi:hypothetical protein